MVYLIGQNFKSVLKMKVGFLVAVAALLLLSSCTTTRKKPVMTGTITRARMRVADGPVKPSLEARKLRDAMILGF